MIGPHGISVAGHFYFPSQWPALPPIPHQVRQIIADGPTVAVHHHIDATRGQPAMDVVDIYQSARGRITERTRIVQPSAAQKE